MAFVKLEKGMTGRQFDDLEEIRMGSHRTKQGRTVYLTLTRTVVERAGWTITKGDTRQSIAVRVNEGVGEDAGFLLLTEDKDHGYQLGSDAKRTHAFATNLSYSRFNHYVLNDDSVVVHSVEFTVDEKEHSVLIQCPDWLRYNPQSYTEPEKTKPQLELVPPKKEDKKPSRPTIRAVRDATDEVAAERPDLALNRRQRRLVASTLTRAMR
jgi:hypothetical protein